MKFFKSLLYITFFLCCTLIHAQNSQVKTRVYLDSTRFFIGDKINLHLEVETPSKYDINLNPKPTIDFDTSAFEIQSYGAWKESVSNSGQTIKQLDVAMMAWDTGEYILRIPRTFLITDKATTPNAFQVDSVKLTIQYPNDVTTMNASAPINDIIKEERHWEDVLPFLILLPPFPCPYSSI